MLDFLATTVGWWVGRMERFITGQTPNPQFVKINVDALLRSDAETRWKIHTAAVRTGVHSQNDVRRLEDEEPIDGGDEYLWPPFAVKTEATADDTSDQPIADPTTGGAAA